tara:strand:- start:3000 stop:3512 length:513 start_codon:yes stop_codon:yes gene_type:complete
LEIDKLQFKPVSYSDDISNLALMAKEIWEEHYTPIIGKDQVNYMIDKFQSESAIIQQIKDDYDYFIVSRYSQHIGYLCFIKNNEINSLFLSKIYLKKPFRRMGYGREMFEFVKRQASKKRYQSITLTVNKYNKNTIRAYQKYGFVKKRELVIDIGNGFVMDDFEMIYEIK